MITHIPSSWLPKTPQKYIILKELPDGGKVGEIFDSNQVDLMQIGFHHYLPYILLRDGFIIPFNQD